MTTSDSNLAQIDAFLAAHGEGTAQRAGIEANLETESGWNPGASNSAEGAIGIAQWEGGRRTGPNGLDAYAASTHGSETSLQTQLGYLWSELTGPYQSVLSAINGTNDPATVARDWDVGSGGVNSGTGFENSSGSTTQTRINNARTLYAQLGAGGIAGGATSATSSGAQSLTDAQGIGNPLNIGKDAINSVRTIVFTGLFVLGGLGLVAAGLYKASGGSSGPAGTAAKLAAL